MRETSLPAQHPQAGQAARLPAPDVNPGRPGHPVRPQAEGARPPIGLVAAGAAPPGSAPAAAVESLRGRTAFDDLRRHGRRVRRGTVTVTWVRGDPAGALPRVAYAVGRRAGGAVVRNRIRRRLRAVVREVSAELAPGAYLVGAGADAATLPYGELRTTVTEALRAATSGPGPRGPRGRPGSPVGAPV